MGRDQHLGMLDQRVIGRRRLGLEDVDRRAGDLARVEGLDQGGLVDQAAPAQLMIRTPGFIWAESRGADRCCGSRRSAACAA